MNIVSPPSLCCCPLVEWLVLDMGNWQEFRREGANTVIRSLNCMHIG